MVSSDNTQHPHSDNDTSAMALPEGVIGFIDIKTLADIHRYLRESATEDDILLAAWVQENYLYESLDQSGRMIRTSEGFSQLDRAYRRVRSLTNKAQDKWPFFDRNWKSMSTATVRNNARGEASPGILYKNGGARGSPLSNSLTLPTGKSPDPDTKDTRLTVIYSSLTSASASSTFQYEAYKG